MVFASLESGIIALIVGIALILVARLVHIESTINKVLYIIGILLVVVAIIIFAIFFAGIVV